MIELISTDAAPGAIGPYAQALVSGGLVFLSGQIALDPSTGTLVAGDIAVQTRRCLLNLGAVLTASGCGFNDVVKTTVYLTDLADFAMFNEVYGQFFSTHRPARSTVQVSALPRASLVEVDAIAVRSSD